MMHCSKRMRSEPLLPITSSTFGLDEARRRRCTTSTLRCFASTRSPPVSFLTTAPFQARSLSRSICGAPKAMPCAPISSASSMTLAACSSALEGMQPTFRHTPPSARPALDQRDLAAEVGGAERGGVAAGTRSRAPAAACERLKSPRGALAAASAHAGRRHARPCRRAACGRRRQRGGAGGRRLRRGAGGRAPAAALRAGCGAAARCCLERARSASPWTPCRRASAAPR